MSELVKKKFMKTREQSENAKNKVYSGKLPYLTGMVKALYREFQELLGSEVIDHYWSFLGNEVSWSKDGIELKNGEVISGEEYIERTLQCKKDNEQKFKELEDLTAYIQELENAHNKKLTGKCFKTYTQNEIAKFIFEKYGKKCGFTYDEMKSAISDFYDYLDKKSERPLSDEEKAVFTIAMSEVPEKLAKVLFPKE